MLQSRIAWRYWRVLAASIALGAIAFGVVQGVLVFRDAAARAERLQASELQTVVAQVEAALEAIVESLDQVCRMPWSSPLLGPQDQRAEFQRLLRRHPEIVEIQAAAANGSETAFVSRLGLDRTASGSAVKLPATAGQGVTVGPVLTPASLAPRARLTCREPTGAGLTILADINLEFISELVGRSGQRLGGETFLVDSSQRLIAHSRPAALFSAGDGSTLGVPAQGAGTGVATRWIGGLGDGALVSSTVIRAAPWRLAVSQPMRTVLAPALSSVAATALVALFLALVSAGVAVWLASYLTDPIRALRRAVSGAARGDLAARVEPATADEIGDLAKDFNFMAEQLRDYTQGLEQKVAEKTSQLELANRHKSEFLANMSHELRTPLNAVIGFSEVLQEEMFGPLNPKQLEYVRDINSSGQHLLSLINDILDLSKIEAGRMELDPIHFDVAAALENCRTLIRERAHRHGLRLVFEVPADLGSWTADERKFKQVVVNLLSNAVKFTPSGGEVRVVAGRDAEALVVSISDTGPGIAPADQAKVFEEFSQVKAAGEAKHEGTGLGLALARRFVELHGGSIELESQLGKGARFTVRLPRLETGGGAWPGA